MMPFDRYSSSILKKLTDGRTVSPLLPYESLPANAMTFNDNRGHLSLSGAQVKYSMVLSKGRFTLSSPEEQGTYILKPSLNDFENRSESPANEHLTMQIASNVYGIETAANALCFFKNGEPAYITRRYDVLPDGAKRQQEDFASIAGINEHTHGRNFKYSALSYEGIGMLIRKYIPSWKIDLIRFYDLILFNFLFSNGDAHLKNFSVLRTDDGDYRLSPAYDLINTRIHLPSDGIFALSKGLFTDGRQFPLGIGHKDFHDFGIAIGLGEKTVKNELNRFCSDYPAIERMVEESFLSDNIKEDYWEQYRTRLISYLRC